MNTEIDISKVTLSTNRLLLRPWKSSDIEDFFEYASVNGVGQMAGWMPHKNLEETREILKMFIAEKKTFALEFEGKVIGSLGIEAYNETKFPELQGKKGREIGYVLSKNYWGKGLMPEALQRVLQYLFQEKGLDFVLCSHSLSNKQSQRVQEKCGFKHYRPFVFKTRYGEVRDSWMSIQYRNEKVEKECQKERIATHIRQADEKDLSRIAEILVYNNRINYWPIFKDEGYSFGELTVLSLVQDYLQNKDKLKNIFVYDDGVVKGFIQLSGQEIEKLYTDTFFQNQGIGSLLISFAKEEKQCNFLWALEKNTGALGFYQCHGFHKTGEKKSEEGTSEYLIKLAR